MLLDISGAVDYFMFFDVTGGGLFTKLIDLNFGGNRCVLTLVPHFPSPPKLLLRRAEHHINFSTRATERHMDFARNSVEVAVLKNSYFFFVELEDILGICYLFLMRYQKWISLIICFMVKLAHFLPVLLYAFFLFTKATFLCLLCFYFVLRDIFLAFRPKLNEILVLRSATLSALMLILYCRR